VPAQEIVSASGDEQVSPDPALLHERVLSLPGDPARPASLQVTVYTPAGPGPFPLVVVNHGSTGNLPRAQQPRMRYTFAAYYFLSRGYAVAMPMMRGYAGSGGHPVPHGCDAVAAGLDSAKDIAAVIGDLKQQPYIDGSRIMIAGQSFGGWNALATGTLAIPGVKGIVDFAGGMRETDCADQDGALIAAAGGLGARTAIPSIWFYGDNDSIFPPPLWHAMHQRYVEAGGKAQLVAYGPFGTDSHNMLASSMALPLWVPQTDAFLARLGLPAANIHPEYLPPNAPPPSHYAAIDDVAAVPVVGVKAPGYYRQFLQLPLPRAIAIGPNSAGRSSGGFDPAASALQHCNQHGPGCRLYAVNNEVVWAPPASMSQRGRADKHVAAPQ
jgi:dienelactone hydrolase